MTTTRNVLAGTLATALLAGCSLLDGGDPDAPRVEADTFEPSRSMTAQGERLATAAELASRAPSYDVRASVAPASGRVRGIVVADLPVGSGTRALHLRYFAGLPDFEADARLGQVTVDDEPVHAERDASIVTVPLPADHADRVRVRVPFDYRLPMAKQGGGILDALGGMGAPADVGLLARRPDAWNLGHWFPVWVPEGNSAEPRPAGFGDIGNFPAALMRLELTVPDDWTVVDGGVRTSEERDDGRVTVTSEGYGMNDLVVSLLRGYVKRSATLTGELDGVTVTAYGPRKDQGELPGVLDETVTALEQLSRDLVPYPWREFDIVSAPLGSGVGGMEWPGATWIEPALFAGGLPGLGDLDKLLGEAGLEGLDLGSLLGAGGSGGSPDGGGLDGEVGLLVETLRPWTIAHEVGHEWWHILVGNDSILDPVVDEPLAQYSACLVMRASRSSDADAACSAQIDTAYEQMRMMGDADGPAARATDEFSSSGQYAGVVYGKAAAFYLALESAYGRDTVTEALGAVAREHAFSMMSTDDLRDALADRLDRGGAPGRLDRLWQRWIQGTHGDADLEVDPSAGPGGLAGGLSGALNGLLEDLLGG